MPYVNSFLRLVVSGTLYTDEQFSYGLALIDAFDLGSAPSQVPQAVIDAVTAFHSAQGVSHQRALVTTIKLNEIGEDGKYTSQGDTVLHEYTSPVAGYSTAAWPPQCALAVSLRTQLSRGRAHAGRFYLPYANSVVGNDGRIDSTSRGQVITAATAFLNALNDAVPGYRVGVVSNIGTGAQAGVTHVRVGRVVDTMRSRRTSLDEDYADGPDLDPA